jgi:ribosomal protein L7Ae-like RNA K-turn-binding protein
MTPWKQNCEVRMDSKNILSFLGLALRGGRLAVGEEPVEAVTRARDARLVLLASDATAPTRRRALHFAEAGQCLILPLPFTKAELGQTLGRTAVAVVALTDVGMAASLVHRLEELDPNQYGEAAKRLDLKAQRAAERRAEQKAHEKNVRTGKVKAKKAAEKAAEVPAEVPAEQRTSEKPRRAARPAESGHKHADGERKSAPRSKTGAPRKSGSRPSKENRPKPRASTNRFAHSRPVKKGKGSFRKKES